MLLITNARHMVTDGFTFNVIVSHVQEFLGKAGIMFSQSLFDAFPPADQIPDKAPNYNGSNGHHDELQSIGDSNTS